MMDTKVLLYEQVTQIAEDYFGPAAPRFIDRLIANHLEKHPSELNTSDLPELIEWTRLTASMLTENKTTVNELVTRLELLNA